MPAIPTPAELPKVDPPVLDTPDNLPEGFSLDLYQLYPDIADLFPIKYDALDAAYEDLLTDDPLLLPEDKILKQEEYDIGKANIVAYAEALSAYVASDSMKQAFNSMMSTGVTAKLMANQPEFEGVDFEMNPDGMKPETIFFEDMSIEDLILEESEAALVESVTSQDPMGKISAKASAVNTALSSYTATAIVKNNMDLLQDMPAEQTSKLGAFASKLNPKMPLPAKAGVGTTKIPVQMA